MARARAKDEFTEWYDEKQGDTGDPWHRTLIDPGLFAALGELPRGTRVLDVGCGNGYIARRLARAGANVVGVDTSHALIERARARERAEPLGIVYHRLDAARLAPLADSSFDVAVANMSLIDIEGAEAAVREVGRVVRDGGRFVSSISHPCFDIDTRSTFVGPGSELPAPGETVFRKVTAYRTPHSDRYAWKLGEDRTVMTTGYHRPLSWYAHTFRTGGWVIVDLLEPTPQPEFVGVRILKEWIEAIPFHLVIDARREPRAR
jgi:SAM-dependent methyltransferase